MDASTKPLNWAVYGQYVDVATYDPYIQSYFKCDHAYVRESLEHVRQCSTPKRMIACLGAYGFGEKNHSDGERGPLPQEWRQNVAQAIGAGMKGVTMWVYGGDGWDASEPLKREIAAVNRLLMHIEHDLLLGTPIELAHSDAGAVNTGTCDIKGVKDERWPKDRVSVRSLLCGPDTIIVSAANHIPAQKPVPPTIEPAKDVTITVKLPDFLQNMTAFEATEDGVVPFPCQMSDRAAVLRLDSIESGRVFVLRRDRDAGQQ
jgi:hypothetical protein